MKKFLSLLALGALTACHGKDSATATDPAAAAPGAWAFSEIKDPMTDKMRGIAQIDSLERGPSGEAAQLVIKCDGNGDDTVYADVISPDYLGKTDFSDSDFAKESRNIKTRFDGSPPQSTATDYSDKDALIELSDASTRPWFSKLARAKHVVMQLTKYDFNQLVYTFDVEGARDQIHHVAQVCKDSKAASL